MHNTQKISVPIKNIQQLTPGSHFPKKIPIKDNNHQLLLSH